VICNDLNSEPDVCGRCRNTKAVKGLYKDDPGGGYKIVGKCDRCEKWTVNLWPLVRKSALERLADI